MASSNEGNADESSCKMTAEEYDAQKDKILRQHFVPHIRKKLLAWQAPVWLKADKAALEKQRAAMADLRMKTLLLETMLDAYEKEKCPRFASDDALAQMAEKVFEYLPRDDLYALLLQMTRCTLAKN